MAHRQSLGLSPTTLRGYQRMAKRIQADPLASTALSVLEPFDLDALYGRLTAGGKGPRTVKHHHGVASSALGQVSCERAGILPGPARSWTLLPSRCHRPEVQLRFHDLRHMCATQMVAMGVDVVTFFCPGQLPVLSESRSD